MDHYLGVARDEGITKKEIGAVLACAMAVSAGKVESQFKEMKKKKMRVRK
jgi:hypothetical protein